MPGLEDVVDRDAQNGSFLHPFLSFLNLDKVSDFLGYKQQLKITYQNQPPRETAVLFLILIKDKCSLSSANGTM